MSKYKNATNRRAKPRIVVILLVLAITSVACIAAYAVDNTHDDRINEVKRMRQVQVMGLQRSDNAFSTYADDYTRSDHVNDVMRMRQEQIMGLQQPEITVSPTRESESIPEKRLSHNT